MRARVAPILAARAPSGEAGASLPSLSPAHGPEAPQGASVAIEAAASPAHAGDCGVRWLPACWPAPIAEAIGPPPSGVRVGPPEGGTGALIPCLPSLWRRACGMLWRGVAALLAQLLRQVVALRPGGAALVPRLVVRQALAPGAFDVDLRFAQVFRAVGAVRC